MLQHDQDPPNKVAFVTGASGFIGRFLLAELLRQGYQVFALLRQPKQQSAMLLAWLATQSIEVAADQVQWIQGDLSQPDVGISLADWQRLAQVEVLFHSGAMFGWGLDVAMAKQVNVTGALQLIAACQRHCALQRVVWLSGYMLTMQTHLQQAGINLAAPMQTDWRLLYQRLGPYEASKIEAHYQMQAFAQAQGLAWTGIHPATVIGSSQTGEILPHQQFALLLQQLCDQTLRAVPATPQHRLPLVCVDDLVRMTVAASRDASTIGQCVLVADPSTPNVATVLQQAGQAIQRAAPSRHVPLSVLRLILKWPWLANQLNLSAEMLHFFRTEALETAQADQWRQTWQLPYPDQATAVAKTAQWVARLSAV